MLPPRGDEAVHGGHPRSVGRYPVTVKTKLNRGHTAVPRQPLGTTVLSHLLTLRGRQDSGRPGTTCDQHEAREP